MPIPKTPNLSEGPMQTANTIRRAFLDYFAKNGHEVVRWCRATTRR
ncbi:MAG: hypothetical protein FD119_1755 [Stygiobacter sp.]|nr:MAG: hypothetical protein FD119_1755 [Stygiobacter sp.]